MNALFNTLFDFSKVLVRNLFVENYSVRHNVSILVIKDLYFYFFFTQIQLEFEHQLPFFHFSKLDLLLIELFDYLFFVVGEDFAIIFVLLEDLLWGLLQVKWNLDDLSIYFQLQDAFGFWFCCLLNYFLSLRLCYQLGLGQLHRRLVVIYFRLWFLRLQRVLLYLFDLEFGNFNFGFIRAIWTSQA